MGVLEGKVALITGGNSGIGRASAKKFVEEGAKVVIGGRDKTTLESIQKELGSSVITVAGDLRDADHRKLLLEAVQKFGDHLDILFANAGVGSAVPLESVKPEWAREVFDINVWSPYFLVQEALPLLRSGSSVFVTSSIASMMSMPGMSVYSASKAALTSVARSFAVEFAPRGIRVNTISPGPITTPIIDRLGLSAEQRESFENNMISRVPLGRFGEADEVASLAVYLASDGSSFITGSDFIVDGGARAA